MANELHTMPLKVEALLSSHKVRMLELDEFGAYLKLLCDAWLNGGFLPENATSNAQAMQKLCGCNATDAERIIANVVNVFFVSDGAGRVYNRRQREIYQEVESKSLVAKQKAERAAAARWGKTGNAPSNAQAMHEECHPKPKPKPNINTPHKDPPTPKPKSFKQWTLEEFRQVIADSNQDQLLTDEQCDEFYGYWTEPSASGIPRFRQQQNWDTRRRMQNAKRMIFDNARPKPGGAVSDDVRFAEAQRQPGYLNWQPGEQEKYAAALGGKRNPGIRGGSPHDASLAQQSGGAK